MPEPRLDDPRLFRSNVTDSSELSRFDYPRVSSEPEDLHIQFAILGSINVVVALFTGLLCLAILKSKRLRQKPFDLYLLFIALPDFVSGFCCMLTCLMSARGREYVGERMCGFQSFYLNATVSANTWMNAVIVYEIHKLLRFSHMRRRYSPPTQRKVIWQAVAVYLYACLWGTICALQVDIFGLPFPSHAYGGFYCIPMEEKGNSWFFYLIFLPGVFALPSVYAVFVLVDIMWRGMLPPTGKRRALAIFLMRIVFLYFVVFIPLAMSILIGNFVYFESSWGYYVPAVMTHLQGILTTLLIYFTNDKIATSMRKVLKCDWRPEDNNSAMASTLHRSLQKLFGGSGASGPSGGGSSRWLSGESGEMNRASSGLSGISSEGGGRRVNGKSVTDMDNSEALHCIEVDETSALVNLDEASAFMARMDEPSALMTAGDEEPAALRAAGENGDRSVTFTLPSTKEEEEGYTDLYGISPRQDMEQAPPITATDEAAAAAAAIEEESMENAIENSETQQHHDEEHQSHDDDALNDDEYHPDQEQMPTDEEGKIEMV
mmetsp:Transcript_18138/g.49498  ORF Transcript_18138/g.49498 Transcript_18138/m.49498 type:complete len:547 (-) Transcript_18138:67-1707(-)|eukprot:CAMPEP_0168736862 /NCGR_PEP_ID=MMETSP0724-20121128/10082_1 /TAXON_ID=265536 /ORGANISM="Amphiprora sp., Strain CCMP467" /LENGTH=546 /DNA_ID=CAMNT_0008784079 /DNA_START=162 /DNA_END=1802 /DNA_ORIENTATION=-